jgi:RNAse (barnase) inhibitor barstar
LLGGLRSRWRATETGDPAKLVAEIDQTQKKMWKFNKIGHIGREGGPSRWMEAVGARTAIATQQDFKWKLPAAQEGNDVVFYLATGDAGDGNEADYVVWKNFRLEGGNRPPLPLRDVAGLQQRIDEQRLKMLGRTANYLAAASAVGAEGDVAKVAADHKIDAETLNVWLDYLAIGQGSAVKVEGHFTKKTKFTLKAITGWAANTGDSLPSVIANSADKDVRIPGLVKAHSVVSHPTPTHFTAAGWQSPIDGVVRVEASVADAHFACGNGAEWLLQHRSAGKTGTLWKGEYELRGSATMTPSSVAVRKGELLSLMIGARKGNHICDLTAISLVISETSGEKRVWDLAKDVSADIQAGNPHADRHGNKETWHFYQGEMAKVHQGGSPIVAVPPDSVLATWLAEKDPDKRSELARRVQALATGPTPSQSGSADALLHRQLRTLSLPVDLSSLLKDAKPGERFGRHPLGHAVDATDLVVRAPEVIEFRIPAELAKGRELVGTAEMEAKHGHAGTAQVQVLTSQPAALSVSPNVPILVREGSPARERIEGPVSRFSNLFPPALCYARIVPVDEVVTLTLFHREDDHLKRLMLNDRQAAELDRLWDELYFVSQEPLKLVVAFEQISEFATQDRPDLVKSFQQLAKPIAERADAFGKRLVEVEPLHVDAVLEFADRAWRRPLTSVEQKNLRDLYRELREIEIPHEEAIRLTLARVLTSPSFLYRKEQPVDGKKAGPISDMELANRLSYFLWSSLPDAELRGLAVAGKLTAEKTLLAQARRMLDDERTRRLAIQFACQWLHIRDFDQNDDKNEKLYPQFATLRSEMYEETVRFFEDMFRNDGSILGLLNADHTFLNEKLAKHYGIGGVSGPAWRRVDGVREKGRGGVLGMATVLASQSGASRTSPILRGNWVFETLLGERLPRPPANVPDLPNELPSGLTARQLIEKHSSVAACAKCHVRIDPYGFALEQYDAIGRLRSQVVDTKTKLPSGKKIEGIQGLRDYLAKDRHDDIVQQFCRKLLGYSLGREVLLSDEPLLADMQRKLETNDYRFSVAIEMIVTSRQFREIRGREAADDD